MQERSTFNSLNFITYLYYWRMPMIIVGIVAIIASVLFSSPYFITPKYKSIVVMFPTSTNAISKALLNENPGAKQDVLEFGEEEQAEQLLQILNSSEIRDRVIRKYNLMSHYGIDSSARFKYTKLYDEYKRNIRFRRTEWMAVEVSVLDKDPQMAADIANDIAALLDSTKNKMQKERAFRGFKIVEEAYFKLKNDVQHMEDSLTVLRKLGVFDFESQSEVLSNQEAIALSKNNYKGAGLIREKLDNLAKYGGPYVSIRDALEHDKKQLSLLKSKYEEAKLDAEQDMPQKFIVDKAYKAEKKSYPVRWLIVLVTTLSALFLCILVIVIIDTISSSEGLKKKE